MAKGDGSFTGGHNPWAIAMTVTLATFMEVLDTSIANVSLQHIAGSLSVGQDESTWVLTSYLVSNAIVLPLSGWLATKFGRKRFYMTCVALFTVSSFLCGIAPNLGALIFFRVLQGMGGGGLGPSEQSILADTFPEKKRGMAFAIYGMAVVLAPALGPTLGGYITDHFSWRWIFFINVPVGIFSLFMSHMIVKDPPYMEKERKKLGQFDLVGFLLIAIGLGTLEVVLDKGEREDWFSSAYICWFAAISALTLVSFVVWELRHKNPVVDIRLLANRNFGSAVLMMMTVGAMLFATTVLLPQYAQTQLGYTATLAGMALSPGGILIMCMMPFVGAIIAKVDSRKMLAVGFASSAGALIYMAHHLYGAIDFGEIVRLRMYQSAGLAFLFVPISVVAYVGIPQRKFNQASGMINLARNLGGDFGIAAATTILAQRAQIHQNSLASHTSVFDKTFSQQLSATTQAIAHAGYSTSVASQKALGSLAHVLDVQANTLAYIDTIWLMAILAAAMVPLTFLMKKQDPGKAPAGAA